MLPDFATVPVSPLVTGLLLGALVAAQIGPMTLLSIRTVLRGSVRSGAALGFGVAFIDLVYAGLGAAGAAQLLRFAPLRLALGVLGAAVLIFLGGRTLASAWRIRLGAERPDEVDSMWRALRTGLVGTASNPLTIASWAAAFSAASIMQVLGSQAAMVSLVAGVGIGSLGWQLLLVAVVGVARGRIGDRGLRVADALAGTGLVGFGGLLGIRTVSET